MRAALYARVSTKNNQDPETQFHALREYAKSRGLQTKLRCSDAPTFRQLADKHGVGGGIFHIPSDDVSLEYVDTGVSGSKARRLGLDQLMIDARLRMFDVVIVARFDRFARSTRHLVEALEEFQTLGIDFVSLGESIDTSTPLGKMVFTVLGAVAELERNIIRERVTMGVARARSQGKRIGRPKKLVDRDQLRALFEKWGSVRRVAKALGVGKDKIAAMVNSEMTWKTLSGKPAWVPPSRRHAKKRSNVSQEGV